MGGSKGYCASAGDGDGDDAEVDVQDEEEDDDVEEDDVEEENRSQDREAHVVPACAVERHMNISEEAFCGNLQEKQDEAHEPECSHA